MNADAISISELAAEADEARPEEAFIVDVGGYEGPLHLLLDLARRQKVDLRHVSILELAEQYLGFIREARDQRIDLAADYLLMAAWLAYLKSKLLLPVPERDTGDDISGEDMAERLAFRLKRLEAMREAAKALQDGPVRGEVVFLRGEPEQPKVIRRVAYDTTLWQLQQALGMVRQRQEKEAPHQIVNQMVLPLERARERLRGLAPRLAEWASLDMIRRSLQETDAGLPPRSITASVFSAALELVRDGDVDIRQDAHFAPLYLRNAGARSGVER